MRFDAGMGRADGIRGRALGESAVGVGIGKGLSVRYGGGCDEDCRCDDEGVGDGGARAGERARRAGEEVRPDGEPNSAGVDSPPRGILTRLGVEGPDVVSSHCEISRRVV